MNVYTNVSHTVYVLFILSKISKDILKILKEHLRLISRKYLRTFSLSKKISMFLHKKKSVMQTVQPSQFCLKTPNPDQYCIRSG